MSILNVGVIFMKRSKLLFVGVAVVLGTQVVRAQPAGSGDATRAASPTTRNSASVETKAFPAPAAFPLEEVDANTGFILIIGSPIFKTAFSKELKENDRPPMKDVAAVVLKGRSPEALWTRYQARFESREQFESGLQELRNVSIAQQFPAVFPLKVVDANTGFILILKNPTMSDLSKLEENDRPFMQKAADIFFNGGPDTL